MAETKVVNVKVAHIRPRYKNLQEWMADPNNLYIGRRGVVFIEKVRFPPTNSPWCNPYKVGKDGSREVVITKYKTFILNKIKNGELNIEDLRGKNLGCWCWPAPCHGNVLIELLD